MIKIFYFNTISKFSNFHSYTILIKTFNIDTNHTNYPIKLCYHTTFIKLFQFQRYQVHFDFGEAYRKMIDNQAKLIQKQNLEFKD